MRMRVAILLLAILAGACSREGAAAQPADRQSAPPAPSAPPAVTPVAPVAPRPAPPAPVPVALGAGETVAAELAWPAGGGTVTLAAVARGDEIVIRAFTAAGATEVTRTTVFHGETSLRLGTGGAAIFAVETLLGRVAGVGAIFQYEVARLEWDAAAGAPVVRETWSCSEDDTDGSCERPAWAEGA